MSLSPGELSRQLELIFRDAQRVHGLKVENQELKDEVSRLRRRVEDLGVGVLVTRPDVATHEIKVVVADIALRECKSATTMLYHIADKILIQFKQHLAKNGVPE